MNPYIGHDSQLYGIEEHRLTGGNCYPDGRDVMRKTGKLKFLKPGEKKCCQVHIKVTNRK